MTPLASSFSEIKMNARLSFPARRVGTTVCVCVCVCVCVVVWV